MESVKEQYLSDSYRGLFVTDLDGTLLTDKKEIASVDLDALNRLREKGIAVAIATGRSNFSFQKLMTELGYSRAGSKLAVDYVIFSTGAGVMSFPDNTLLQSFALENEDVCSIADYLETLAIDFMIHKPVPDTKHFLYRTHGGANPDFYSRLKLYNSFSTPISPENLAGFGKSTEVVCIVPPDRGHEVAATIAGALKQFSVIKATSPLDGKSMWIEIFPPNVSKSQTTRFLADMLNINSTNTCAVGNDFNDEDLLQWVGCGYLVSNGPSSMKDQYHGVASNNKGGVSQAIEGWLRTLAND